MDKDKLVLNLNLAKKSKAEQSTVVRLTATKDGYYAIKKADVIPFEELAEKKRGSIKRK